MINLIMTSIILLAVVVVLLGSNGQLGYALEHK